MGRVFIWADEYYPVIGGLELALHKTALSLTSSGIQVVVVTPEDGLDRSQLGYKVVYMDPAHWLQESGTWLRAQSNEKDLVYIARLFRKFERPQLEIMRTIRGFRLLRLPSTWGSRRYSKLDSIIFSVTDAFIALNSLTYAAITRRFPGKEVHLCYNWAAPLDVGMCARRSGFCYAGRLARSKNIQQLMHAWKNVGFGKTQSLTLFADPRQIGIVMQELEGAGTNSNILLSAPYHPNSYEALARFLFLVLPSYREGCPNILVEAYALGVPVIGSEIPGIAEHALAVGAPIIRLPLSSDSIQQALCEANSLSPNQYSQLRQRVREYYEDHFRREMVAPVIVQYLSRLSVDVAHRRTETRQASARAKRTYFVTPVARVLRGKREVLS